MRWSMCMMVMGVLKPTINGGKVFRRRPASVALPRRAFIITTTGRTAPHKMTMMVVQQPTHPQQVTDSNKIGPQVVHHGFLCSRRTRVEIQLAAKNRRKDVELLVRGEIVAAATTTAGGRRRGGWRRIAQGPQATGDALEIHFKAVTHRTKKFTRLMKFLLLLNGNNKYQVCK